MTASAVTCSSSAPVPVALLLVRVPDVADDDGPADR